ncbi:MAG: hypothetical protein ABI208_00805 [Ginsengibacter sp.]|jgi:hypothetical protein
MKNYLLLLLFFLGTATMSYGQNNPGERIQALKIAFITQRLQLTPAEAEKFWPVYREYDNEIKILMVNQKGHDVLETEEKLLNIRKRYKPNFEKILGTDRMNNVFNAEQDFRRVLIKRLKNKKQN